MTIKKLNINRLLKRIINNSYNINELKSFVHLCTSISVAYIKTELYYNRIYFPIIYKENSDLQDIAVDLIAPLFATDKRGDFFQIKKYFNSIRNENNEIVLFELKKLVISATKQGLIEQFKENDPASSKVLRSIKLSPKRRSTIGCFLSNNRTYFYLNTNQTNIPDGLQPELPEINPDDLTKLVINAFKQSKTIPDIIESILKDIHDNESVRDFIQLTTLFKGIRDIIIGKTITIQEEVIDFLLPTVNAQNLDLEFHFKELQKHLVSQINSKYITKKKIDFNYHDYYISVLTEYFRDLIFVNKVNRLPYYMKNGHPVDSYKHKRTDLKSVPTPTKEISIHQHRIEYLIKLGKEHLKQEIFPKIIKMQV